MKNFSLLVLGLSFIASSAMAANFNCTAGADGRDDYSGFGENFTVKVERATLTLEATQLGTIDSKFDSTYHPRAQNAGDVRYLGNVPGNVDDGCGVVQIYLNKDLAAGKNGMLTLSYDCDSDGSGPSFSIYDCKL